MAPKTGSGVSNEVKRVKARPARLQVDLDQIPDDDKPAQTGNVFNIWFLRWSGGDSSANSYTKLKFRVNIAKDSGYTKATEFKSPICLFFCRGCCYHGKNCSYLHRLPTEKDYIIPTQDCFGRDKTSDYKDDMNGVGSFNKTNRTLYVGGLHMNEKVENTLSKHFQEFGSIDKIRVLYNKGCAFISFRLEREAQFAKEAMQSQSLDGNEVLNIRWANEDPNPTSQQQEKRKLEEMALETVKGLLAQSEKRPKKAKVEVEEPDENEPQTEKPVLSLPTTETEPSGIFANSNLSILREIQAKRRQTREEAPKKQVSQKEALSSLAGYGSSDEE